MVKLTNTQTPAARRSVLLQFLGRSNRNKAEECMVAMFWLLTPLKKSVFKLTESYVIVKGSVREKVFDTCNGGAESVVGNCMFLWTCYTLLHQSHGLSIKIIPESRLIISIIFCVPCDEVNSSYTKRLFLKEFRCL